MATVYLAEDLKHHRKVAVKVLRSEIAATLGAGRFAREIEVAARLQHPNILPLLDSGEVKGFFYFVMPYVEGESLRDRLARSGEFAIPDAVRIMMEVADALSHAHAHGVVHRDIKPDNVLLSGRHALVADFGVAKAVSEATGQKVLTSAGVALGTPAYMAPEQATADPHQDHRVDIYALGVLAYELLTGRPPYAASTAQEMLAAHVTAVPEPVERHRPAVSAALAQIVMKCLEKKPADRWQTADELLQHLEPLATPSGGTAPTGAVPAAVAQGAPRRRILLGLAGVATALVVGALAWAAWRWLWPAEPGWELTNIRLVTGEPELELYPAISPDGREVAYAAGYHLDMHISVRDVTGGRALPLTAERAGVQEYPVWAPDGRRIAFCHYAGGGRDGASAVPRMGGPLTPIGRVVQGSGGVLGSGRTCVWGLRGDSVLYQRWDSLFVARTDGAEESFVVSVPSLHSAAWSPDGSRVAFVRDNGGYAYQGMWGNAAPSSIWTIGIRGGVAIRATVGDSAAFHESPAWLPDGRTLLLVSNRDGPRDLYLQRIRADGHPQGPLHRLSTGLEPHTVSISADGRTVAYSRLIRRRNIYRVSTPRSGSVSIREAVPVTTGNQVVESHDLSRDGRWLAFDSDVEGNSDIYLMPAAGGEPRRLTRDPGADFAPSFSPDGREVAFHSTRHGTRDLFMINADGTGEMRLTSGPDEEQCGRFSPDGLRIVYSVFRGGRWEVFALRRDSVGGAWSAPEQLTRGGSEAMPRWSPDGVELVYLSAGGISVLTLGGEERLLVDFGRAGLVFRAYPGWMPQGRSIWFGAESADGQAGIFEVPATGGSPRMVIRFDDPARAVAPYNHTAGTGVMYLTVDDSETDIYVADLRRR